MATKELATKHAQAEANRRVWQTVVFRIAPGNWKHMSRSLAEANGISYDPSDIINPETKARS